MKNRFLKSSLPISCILSSIFAFTPISLADYIPDKSQEPASDKSVNGGRRGVCPELKIPLTILASKNYVGYTASSRPSFGFFIDNSNVVEFRLYEFGDDGKLKKQIGQTIEEKFLPGIRKISPLKNMPELKVGRKYLWQLTIECSKGDFIQSAEFRVKDISPELRAKLNNTEDKAKKLDLYATNGLWYDAFTVAQQMNSNNLSSIQPVVGLLKDLVKWEKAAENLSEDRKLDIQEHVQRLRLIIANYQSK